MKAKMAVGLALIFPVLSLASLEDPFEKRILTPVDPMKYAAGVCPGNPLAETAPAVEKISTSQMSLDARVHRDLRVQSAMTVSDHVYDLPDLEVVKNGRELVDQLKPFLMSLPAAYDFYAYASEPEAGMKYMILSPKDQASPDTPWILSIAGTQSLTDIVADLDLGWGQLQKASRLSSLLTTCLYQDTNGQPLSSHKWIFTGHSLGGGLAQAFAYKIQKERLELKLKPVDLEVFTFNAFGAQDLIEKSEAYHPEIEAYINARNYFVKGDPISRIGKHIGPTYQLTEAGVDPDSDERIISPLELYKRHSMKEVESIVSDSRLLLTSLSNDEVRTPKGYKGLNRTNIALVGAVFRFLPEAIYKKSEDRQLKLLEEATDYLLTLDLKDESNMKALMYVQRLIQGRISSQNSPEKNQNLKRDFDRLSKAKFSI